MDGAERMTLAVDGGLARLRLTRPAKRNAIDERFLDHFAAAVERVAEDRRVRVLLLEAEGPSFCAGFDLDVLSRYDDEMERKRHFTPVMRGRIRAISRALERLAAMEPVTVAALQGAAAGGGFSIALACDLRIVARDARCWYPEVELGTPLSPASTRLLCRLVPAGVAKDIVLTSRRLDAAELQALGLANRVVDGAELPREALALARALADKPASALLTSKATLNAITAGIPVLRTDMIPDRE